MLKSTDWVDTPEYGYDSSIGIGIAALKHKAWLRKQAEYKFVISPRGNSIDCHQTWEMILIGVVPVMRRL